MRAISTAALTLAAALIMGAVAPETSTPAQAAPARAAILLIADPGLSDPNFRETVVLVGRHDRIAGPIGVILNRPLPLTLARTFPENKSLAETPDRVFFGGPVALQALFYIFRAAKPPDDAIEVGDGVYLDWDGERLRELLARETPVEGLRVYAGHSAWAPGQLEREVARGDWKSARPEERIIFSTSPETVWTELDRRARATTARLESLPGTH